MTENYRTVIVDGRKIIVDENGKPCRACNTLEDFRHLGGAASKARKSVALAMDGVATGVSSSSSTNGPGLPTISAPGFQDEPPDKIQLGRHTWTFLHSMAARYPQTPSESEKKEMQTFINLFAKFYPCDFCAKDFQKWIQNHQPIVDSRDALSWWFCDAHNAVNVKLGKPSFDCRFWKHRWLDGFEL